MKTPQDHRPPSKGSKKTPQKEGPRTMVTASEGTSVLRTPNGFTPLQLGGARKTEEAPRVPLFYIDDKEYTIPGEVRVNVAIKYLNALRDKGQDGALAEVMTALLGREAMQALADCDSLEMEDMQQLMKIIEEMMLGAVEQLTGK